MERKELLGSTLEMVRKEKQSSRKGYFGTVTTQSNKASRADKDWEHGGDGR
jgi:hypothetical protein